jgi:hypothetical protein
MAELKNGPKVEWLVDKWKSECANKRREALILTTEADVLERNANDLQDRLPKTPPE